MKDERLERQLQQSLNAALAGLRTIPGQRDRFLAIAVSGRRAKTRGKLSAGLIFALLLLLLSATALAAALLSPREVLEQVAVPLANENDRSRVYSHEELAALLRALDENGITLSEGQQIVQAFQAGHGYWESDTIRAICESAFGPDLAQWTLEEKYVYGEACARIDPTQINDFLLPGEGDMTQAEAASFAVRSLKEKYGVDLPAEPNDQWHFNVWFTRAWDDAANAYDPDRAVWRFEYRRPAGTTIYIIEFDRTGEWIDCSTWPSWELLEEAASISDVLDILQQRDGPCSGWDMQTWAELGQYCHRMTPTRASEWLYRSAGYRMPPEGSLSADAALKAARETLRLEESVPGAILCCTENGAPVYKITLGDPAGESLWCLEVDCKTGTIRAFRKYDAASDDPMMRYVPFSLLESVPAFDQDEADAEAQTVRDEQAALERRYQAQYGPDWHFWPPEKQVEVYRDYYLTVPTPAEYDQAVETALAAIRAQEGQEALDALGEYAVGLTYDRREMDGGLRVHWEVYITSDPVYLSDGWRVHYIEMDGAVRELEVLDANAENG